MERLIFHVDVNSAYLSWESARRVAAGEEDLRLLPSAISGNPENRTGGKVYPCQKVWGSHGRTCSNGFKEMPASDFSPAGFSIV